VPGVKGDDRAYVIRRGVIRAEGPAPQSASELAALEAKALDAPGARSQRQTQTVPGHEVDEVLLVAGWFRKYAKELERTTPLSERPAARSA